MLCVDITFSRLHVRKDGLLKCWGFLFYFYFLNWLLNNFGIINVLPSCVVCVKTQVKHGVTYFKYFCFRFRTKSCMHPLQNIYYNFSRELLGVIRSFSYHLQYIVWKKNSLIWWDSHMCLSVSHISTMKRRKFICIVIAKEFIVALKKDTRTELWCGTYQ